MVTIDGIHCGEHVVRVALGIDARGDNHVLGPREGSTEATRVVAALLVTCSRVGSTPIACGCG